MSVEGETPAGDSHLPRTIWIVAVVGFFIAVGFGVMSPVLPIYVRLFGVSSFLVGLVSSSLSILRLATMPGASRLLRYIGPRELVIAGNLLLAGTTFMMGISNSYWPILIWRGLGGFGSALYGVASMALVFTVTPPHQRGRANSMVGGGFVLGGMAGPALGGLVAQVSMHAPFFFYSATLTVAALVVLVAIPRTPLAEQRRRAADTIGFRGLLHDRRFVAVLATAFANLWQSHGVRNLLVPLFIVEVLGLTTREAGLAFSIAAVVQFAFLQPAGWATDRLGRRPVLLFGTVTMAVVGASLALTNSYVVLVVLLCVYSVGATATGSSAQAMLADVVPPTSGSGLAAFQMFGDSGQILGPLVAGALIDVLPMRVAWFPGTVFFAIAAVLVWRAKPPSSADGRLLA
jgi:MFS family permease